MRFNDRISFVTIGSSEYNPDTGEYEESKPIKETLPCNISTIGIGRSKELFGEIDKVVLVARLQHPYNKSYDHIEIKGQKYDTKRQSDYRKGVFYLEGDPS